MMRFLMDVWDGHVMQAQPWYPPSLYREKPALIGIVLAAILYRSWPEYIHANNAGEVKVPGKDKRGRGIRGPNPTRRAKDTTSHRLHIAAAFARDWPILHYAFMSPKESKKSTKLLGPMHMRIFGKDVRDFLVDNLRYWEDTNDVIYPANHENLELRANLSELAKKCDRFLDSKTVELAFDKACKDMVEGHLDAPDNLNHLPLPPENENELGYVYFMMDWESRLAKIGRSVKPLSRMEGLQTGNGHKLFVICGFRGGNGLEALLHMRLHHCHRRGEWYEADSVYRYLSELHDGDELKKVRL